MTHHRITVLPRHDDHSLRAVVNAAHQLGFYALTHYTTARVFFIEGQLSPVQIDQIAQELLSDPLTESYTVGEVRQRSSHLIEVSLQVGVTDPVAENLYRAIQQLGIQTVTQTATAQRYELDGNLSPSDLDTLAQKLLCNTVIQRYQLNQAIQPPFITAQVGDGWVEVVALREASDAQLLHISKTRRLSLDLAEMQAIQAYYRQTEREAHDIELEMLAQTWSEHCVHKTFRATIDFVGANGQQETIHGLLKTYIRAATEKLNKEWVVSAFVDNAGIIRFDDKYDLAFKVETHNHPSALEPFGGANTGVGGVVRDVLGVSARPIANTDILCFGYPDTPQEKILDGILHPRRIQDGVIAGIEDYGNKMGIPTVNGAIVYDDGYIANPLVFAGCLGILPHGTHPSGAQDGDYIVVLGGRTGRDGLRGATFSSMEMDTQTSEIASISVQIGHPINEKQVQEVVLKARDERLYTAITDCGAGGLSSAVGEMGKDLGATVELSYIPLKYPGLRPWEIWLSEAQERMVMAVSPQHWGRLCEIAQRQDVEITNIGIYENSGKLVLHYHGTPVGQLDMHFLHEGIPTRHLKATWSAPQVAPQTSSTPDTHTSLLKLLAHPNIRSKESVVRLYDHEVQGGTVVKPLVGKHAHGHGNASVIVPLDTRHEAHNGQVRGVAIGNGICPQYGTYDPYAMAWNAIDEAFRNIVAVGANPDSVAILDNFCWGNPNLSDRLGSLVMTSKGCHDAALAYGAPFISGKDSLNNEYADADGTRHAIPGTLLISAIGRVDDIQKTATSDLKRADNHLYLVGETHDELGASHYHLVNNIQGGQVPQPNLHALDTLRQLHHAIQNGWVRACHDISEGGLAVTIAEMCIGGQLGATLTELSIIELFSESATRFIIEVAPEYANLFVQAMTHTRYLGVVTHELTLTIGAHTWALDTLEQAWRGEKQPIDTLDPQVIPANSAKTWTTKARTHKPKTLILHANGSNRDRDAKLAIEHAEGEADIVHINQVIAQERRLADYDALIIPGGFSYGDDLGAGQLWAQDLRYYFESDLRAFAQHGKAILGICNGFQVLMKSGLLPHADFAKGEARQATLTYNALRHFECRWVYLRPNSHSHSLFTHGLSELIYCPVAHGEGRVVAKDATTLQALWDNGQIPLQYVDESGQLAGYPYNPNGSDWNIASVCNAQGNVMGLMPHPEDHIFGWQNPRWHRGADGMLGLPLFKNLVRFA